MPVSNKHLDETCQVWDGLTFFMLPNEEAAQKEKQGLVQRTRNLQAKDLMTAAQFNERREALAESAMPPGMEKKTRKKRTYKTRQMKADTDGSR